MEMIAQNDFASDFSIALTSFVGQEHEMVEVKRPLSSARLLTLTGLLCCHKLSRKHLDCASSPVMCLWKRSRISSHFVSLPKAAHPWLRLFGSRQRI
jgi:hypothetical protein